LCRAKRLLDEGTIDCIEGVFPLRGTKTSKSTRHLVCVIHATTVAHAHEDKDKNVLKASRKQDPAANSPLGALDNVLVTQRPASSGLLAGLFDFPSVEVAIAVKDPLARDVDQRVVDAMAKQVREQLWLSPTPTVAEAVLEKSSSKTNLRRGEEDSRKKNICGSSLAEGSPRYAGTVRHVFSHVDLFVSCFVVKWSSATTLRRAAAAMAAADSSRVMPFTPSVQRVAHSTREKGARNNAAASSCRKRSRSESMDAEESTTLPEAPVVRVLTAQAVKKGELPVSRLVHKLLELVSTPHQVPVN
jgi:hypothetical protein